MKSVRWTNADAVTEINGLRLSAFTRPLTNGRPATGKFLHSTTNAFDTTKYILAVNPSNYSEWTCSGIAPSRPPGLVRELLASAGGKQPGGRERHYSRGFSQEVTTKGRHAAKGDLTIWVWARRSRSRGVSEWVCPFPR